MTPLKISEADYDQLAKTLRRVDFFKPLTLDQLARAIPHILLFGFESGHKIFSQGDDGDAFYIVLDGSVSVKVSKLPLGLFPKTVATIGPGGFFGEMALFQKETRSATVACDGPTRLFVLLRRDFDKFIKENPGFRDEVERIATQRGFHTRGA